MIACWYWLDLGLSTASLNSDQKDAQSIRSQWKLGSVILGS